MLCYGQCCTWRRGYILRTAVLVSGRGSNLQALLDACNKGFLPIEIVGVGSDQLGTEALKRSHAAGIPSRVFQVSDYPHRRAQEEDILILSLIHISEPTRLGMISYAVFCLKKKKAKYPAEQSSD